ncbi:recombination protein O N-terminal domain-containing protein [Candidatus Kaiserbacteria bacterium]|nr:recombination protein O N-terminal domain-containing protein [Candidatus Kaiserbacteria bacterium]
MYKKYTTNAVVLGNQAYGEHDKVFAFYTRDFGLVRARASAVRTMGSKMRTALSLFAHTSVSLVRGTRGWRVAGSMVMSHEALSPEGVHAYARIAQLCLRLVRGEEANPYLLEVLVGARDACVAHTTLSLASVELLCVARILYALGYISPQALTAALFTHAQYADTDITTVEGTKKDMLSTVNKALSETQL